MLQRNDVRNELLSRLKLETRRSRTKANKGNEGHFQTLFPSFSSVQSSWRDEVRGEKCEVRAPEMNQWHGQSPTVSREIIVYEDPFTFSLAANRQKSSANASY
jgi:hypothetical protein